VVIMIGVEFPVNFARRGACHVLLRSKFAVTCEENNITVRGFCSIL